MDPIMYIFINSDLNLSKGRMIAQACHVTSIIIENIIRQGYEVAPPPPSYFTFMKWRKQCTKIILKATTEQLKELMKLEGAVHFIDSGDRIPDNSLTVVGFPPSATMDVKEYKLL
jgi:peptidyl-tRNA hydrolase